MINRVLIRIKVVQMLYSYLLSRSDFRILPRPEAPSRDMRYAYSAYIDMLLLIIELSGYPVDDGAPAPSGYDAKLHDNRVAKALAVNDTIRDIILRGNTDIHNFDSVLNNLRSKILDSAAYADYAKKRKREISDDATFWITMVDTILSADPETIRAWRADSNFTNAGFQKATEMAVETLRSYSETRQMLISARADLKKSLDTAYMLYLSLLQLIVELTYEQEDRLDFAKNKYLVTSADRNPNTRLVNNALARYLREDECLLALLKEYKLTGPLWHPALKKKLLDSILQSDLYADYLAAPTTDFKTDTEFWRDVMTKIVFPSEALAEDMEDRNVFWNDDLEIMSTFVLKTIRRIAAADGAHIDLLPKYKDDEDEAFGPELFDDAVANHETYRSYIDRFVNSEHWDPERMAFMDIVIMITAIAELVNYPKIPVAVTVNEYVEIANHYSTEKSGAFINGILFSIINYLNEQGIINKQ